MAADLDPAALTAIFSKLPGPALAAASQVCKSWRSVALSEVLWEQQCRLLEPHPHLARDDLLPDFGGSQRAYYAWRWPMLRQPLQRIVVESDADDRRIVALPAAALAGGGSGSEASSRSCGLEQRQAAVDASTAQAAQLALQESCVVDTSPHTFVHQATLAPAGGVLAFTEMGNLDQARLESRVVVADARTGRRVCVVVLDAEYPPFYYMWSACGTRLLFLSNWQGDVVALRAVDVAPALLPVPRPVAREVLLCTARPLFLCVSPTSTRLLWHGNAREMGLCDAATGVAEDGAEHDCFFANALPCGSQAPQWVVDASGADWLLLPIMHPQPADGEAGVLVAAPLADIAAALEADGSRLSPSLMMSISQQIAPFSSSRDLFFSASPDGGSMVAWCDSGELHVCFRCNGAVHRVFPPPPSHPPEAAGNPSRGGREAPHWLSGSVLAMQWSPSGRRLLLLLRKGGAGPMIALSRNPQFRWAVYDPPAAPPPLDASAGPGPGWLGTLTYCRPFNPTLEFLDRYLPFWDQYSLSMRLWDPTSAAFCFASRGRPSVHEVSGEANVSVQPVPLPVPEGPSSVSQQAVAVHKVDAPPPVWLAPGSMASWSWQ